jgi:predicted dehydrogenase
MSKLAAAVIGVGFVGRAHLESLRRQGIPVQGILGSSPERTEEARRSLGLDRAYPSVQELVQDPSVNVVHVCTPNHVHYQQSDAALKAGKHVICEKPLAMDTRQSRALIEAAKKHGRVGAVAYNLRYYPLCQEARSIVERGLIGEPRLVHASFLQDWLLYPSDWNWRLEPELGGELRAVSDIGTHCLDLLMWLTGRKVTEVSADLATMIPVRRKPRGRVETFQKAAAMEFDEVKISTDDYASVLLRLDGGTRGIVTVSQISAGRKARLGWEIDGSEGSLAWNSEEPNTLWLGHRSQPNQSMPKDPALMSPAARRYSAYPGGHTEGYPDTFARLFQDFYAYVEAGDFSAPRSFPTFETGHEELLLCNAILTSSQESKWVRVNYH